MSAELFSIRMRAERDGGHCCGAERIAPAGALPALAAELVSRALGGGALPEAVHCSIERVAVEVPVYQLPEVRTRDVSGWRQGRQCARDLLRRAGVAAVAADLALQWLADGAAPGRRTMRGAMIVDAETGERLETDPARGVRVSRMDLAPESRETILAMLAAANLAHHRVAEALVLAGKVLRAPGIVAEVCWSDDPDYVTGYVAAPGHGYQRISRLKAHGDPHGGRALFVNRTGWSPEAFIRYLEFQAVLFAAPVTVHPPQPWNE